MNWLDDPTTLVAAWPAFALPLFIFVSALLEYVVPPYWGDMFVLLGFFLAGQGAASPALIFAAALFGSLAGAWIAFHLGGRYGLRIARRFSFRARKAGFREKVIRLLQRHGERLLITNRFVPVVRGILLYAAGALKLRLVPTLFYTTLSNLLWLVILGGIGLSAAGSWEEILASFRRSNKILGIVATVAVAAWITFLVWRARGDESGDESGDELDADV